eukprot:235932_1
MNTIDRCLIHKNVFKSKKQQIPTIQESEGNNNNRTRKAANIAPIPLITGGKSPTDDDDDAMMQKRCFDKSHRATQRTWKGRDLHAIAFVLNGSNVSYFIMQNGFKSTRETVSNKGSKKK